MFMKIKCLKLSEGEERHRATNLYRSDQKDELFCIGLDMCICLSMRQTSRILRF